MIVVLDITLSKVIMREKDCGTGDNAFKSHHVYRGMIVVLYCCQITQLQKELSLFLEE